MDLQATTIDEETARVKFREYRDEVRRTHDAEDAQIMSGYREVVRGHQLISLTATLRAGGRDANGLPNLAVCRADAKKCWLEDCTFGGAVTFTTKRQRDGRAANNERDVRRFPFGTLPDWPLTEGKGGADTVIEYPGKPQTWNRSHYSHSPRYLAIVPTVPPALRPARSLGSYDILWEVDQWALDPTPPVDPALIRRIGGDLYAVMAVWDLTDLERFVLQGRA